MKKTLTLLALLVSLAAGAQQTERKWHFEADLRYHHLFFYNSSYEMEVAHYDEATESFVSDGIMKGSSHSFIFDQHFPQGYGGNALVLMETYDINRRLTVGLGLELARYNQLEISGMNVMASLRYKPWTQHPYGYWFTELGLGMVNLGWGTSVRLNQKRRLDFKVGYDMQLTSSAVSDYWKSNTYMHCLQASVGLVF